MIICIITSAYLRVFLEELGVIGKDLAICIALEFWKHQKYQTEMASKAQKDFVLPNPTEFKFVFIKSPWVTFI